MASVANDADLIVVNIVRNRTVRAHDIPRISVFLDQSFRIRAQHLRRSRIDQRPRVIIESAQNAGAAESRLSRLKTDFLGMHRPIINLRGIIPIRRKTVHMAIITADMQNICRSQPVRELQDRKLARRDNFMIFFVVVEIALNILDTEIKSSLDRKSVV